MIKSCHTCINCVSCECVVSHMNESCPIWMSHVTCEWGMSYMYEWRHIRMSHVAYEWVMPHRNESRQIWMSQVTYECKPHANPHANHMSVLDMPTLHNCLAIAKKLYHFAVSQTIQGSEDSYDPVSCRSFSTKEPLNIGHFCRQWPINIRDPMSLRHPVPIFWPWSPIFTKGPHIFAKGPYTCADEPYTYRYIQLCTYKYICIDMYIYMYIQRCTHIYTLTHTRTCMNICIYIHTYKCVCVHI